MGYARICTNNLLIGITMNTSITGIYNDAFN